MERKDNEMNQIRQMLQMLREASGYAEKTQILSYLLSMLRREKLTADDRNMLSDFAFSEVDTLMRDIPRAKNYKTKDEIFRYEDILLGLIIKLHPKPDTVSPEDLQKTELLVQVVEKARYLEITVDEIFQKSEYTAGDIRDLLRLVSDIKDEYQRGRVFAGLLHYRDKLSALSDEAKGLLAEHTCAEIRRALPIGTETDADLLDALEIAADVCREFMNEALAQMLTAFLSAEENRLRFYAAQTLLLTGHDVDANVVASLARDPLFADMICAVTKQCGRAELFPSEYADPVYLAKCDLSRWLYYPTELGKLPDEIEFLGSVKVKKELYYIFRYRSDSENLDEERRGQWLIGWSSADGGTFSNFDLYAPFEQKTPEKTVKLIKKKLL